MDRLGGIDQHVPHTARIWNYWLGGKDNFAADRAVGDQVQRFLPDIVTSARADRKFLHRAVRHLVSDAGIRQFLDVGTGLPTADNTHEVAQRIAPETRIVYADNDPLVLTHARALLTSTPAGATDYIDADARDTSAILAAAAKTLDFEKPVAVMLLGVLNFIGDDEEAVGIVRRLMAAVPSGSYLAIAHPTTEVRPEESAAAAKQWNETATPPITLRSKAQLLDYFDGLSVLDPGVVTCTKWRPEPGDPTAGTDVYQFCGLARKP
ncbi:SAM-dependent methyltransferase [Actinoplanes sp. TBRC 11911]|uniref:SAM-dependent methyltransferase n=1 Tax=Actinoplanes sp. TBRC 11911 TaxID=2729386 RepID=UPI00145ED75D|nr:SAM-dependent methyltransferase [Actinoplanes sp. TBRC 11911]NMO56957.1 SAM-dependent methyltransferase [Actinoplanes sp. TBRC 11911]